MKIKSVPSLQDAYFICFLLISACLQFTKYGLVLIWHEVKANKFGKDVLACQNKKQTQTFILSIIH